MALSDYKRKEGSEDGVAVDLKNGVTAVVREYGTPQFWSFFFKYLSLEPDEEGELKVDGVTDEADEDATTHAISHHLVVSIEDGETVLDTSDAIHEIISDPTYWELKRDILVQTKNLGNFSDTKKEEAVKKD